MFSFHKHTDSYPLLCLCPPANSLQDFRWLQLMHRPCQSSFVSLSFAFSCAISRASFNFCCLVSDFGLYCFGGLPCSSLISAVHFLLYSNSFFFLYASAFLWILIANLWNSSVVLSLACVIFFCVSWFFFMFISWIFWIHFFLIVSGVFFISKNLGISKMSRLAFRRSFSFIAHLDLMISFYFYKTFFRLNCKALCLFKLTKQDTFFKNPYFWLVFLQELTIS